MPCYLVLIYGDEQRWAAASSDWNAANGRAHRDFLQAAGASVLAGGELVPSTDAVSIRCAADGEHSVTPGPFVDAPFGIGGFYLLEADDLDAAVGLARCIPEASAPASGVEIREMPAAATVPAQE